MPETIKILFIGYANEAKSPMAEALAQHLANERAKIQSGGIIPSRTIAPEAIQVLTENGVPLTTRQPRAVDEIFACDATHIIGLTDALPNEGFGKRLRAWPIPTPKPGDIESYRRAYAAIETRVRELLAEEGLLRAPEAIS